MTTPTPPAFGSTPSPAGSRLGLNGLQSVVDQLSQAVSKLASVASQMAAPGPSGTTTSSYGATGQTFTSGSFPRMTTAVQAFMGSGVGTPANYATTPNGGQGNGQGGWGNPTASMPTAMGSMGNAAQGMLGGSGSAYNNMITMNQYASMSSLGFGPGTNLGQGFRAMYNQAFGTYGQNLNAVAFNSSDAAQGYSTLQSIAASPYVNSTSLGRAGFGAYAGFGVANPSLGAAGSAQAAQQLYSGQTSMLMRMYGYGQTPRAGMGQGNPLQMGQVMQNMLQRWYGQGSVSQKTLNAGLANNGRLNVNLQALGLDPNTMGPALQAYNKLFQQGLGANQAQTLLNDAAQNKNYNGTSAQKLLSNKYGIATSDLQKLKDTTAVGTSTTSGEMNGFDSAISQATTSLQKFDTVLSEILKVTGLGSMIGGMHGFTGTMNAVGGIAGSLFKGVTGMVTRLGGALPGGGSGPASGGHGTPGSSATSMSRTVQTAIKDAESQLGRPYVWGGDSPSVGFDCSGLIEWAYGQAGIKLPRTSQEQWQFLQGHSIALDKVQAGDIVFQAGSDGSAASPGHEAMMISNKQIIESPYTGANIRVRAYNPSEWQHAGRPAGGGGSGSAGPSSGTGSNGNSSPATGTGTGNSGLGLSTGTYGSSNELANTSSALLGGIAGGSGGAGLVTFSSGNVGNGQGSGSTANVKVPGNASAKQAMAIAKKLAQPYGWANGVQWNDLVQLWTKESSWQWDAANPSGAYGIPQALPGNKMASAGSDWRTNPATQIKWGLGYIKQRWDSPAGALRNEDSVHWYEGGIDRAHPGVALVGERGPELVRLSGGQQVVDAGRTKEMLNGTAAKPGQGPWSSGTAAHLMLANMPQNNGGQGRCEVNLNMPAGAIVIHSQGTTTDVSNNVRQIMAGIRDAMAEDEMIKKIMQGVMG